jgi:hypothetical protein
VSGSVEQNVLHFQTPRFRFSSARGCRITTCTQKKKMETFKLFMQMRLRLCKIYFLETIKLAAESHQIPGTLSTSGREENNIRPQNHPNGPDIVLRVYVVIAAVIYSGRLPSRSFCTGQ